MSSASPPVTSPPPATSRVDKKKSTIVVLRLQPELLRRFPSTVTPQDSKTVSNASSAPTPVEPVKVEDNTLRIAGSSGEQSEINSTPAPSTEPVAPIQPVKKRKGPAPGFKRNLNQATDGVPKERGKPGPKKKPRLEDGTIDHAPKTTFPIVNGITAHKLGPKANQGAINAGLRALDRTGKPCRKWIRKPFQIKSFTGTMWEVPSWRGNQKLNLLNGDDSTDSPVDLSQHSSSDVKLNDSSTAMDSNGGDRGEDRMAMSTPTASSPVAPISTLAVSG